MTKSFVKIKSKWINLPKIKKKILQRPIENKQNALKENFQCSICFLKTIKTITLLGLIIF